MVLDTFKAPKLIYKTSSEYNDPIELFQIGDYRRLCVKGTIQSISSDNPSCKKRIWGRLVALVKEKRPEAKSILLLGLGGGTMVHLISRELPDAHVVAVEIDSVIIDIAKEFFDLDDLTNLKVIEEDVLRVISSPGKFDLLKDTFDVVIVDIYCGAEYPDLGDSGSFFSGIKWFLRTGGLAVFNRIYIKTHQDEVDTFLDSVREVFSNVSSRSVAGTTNSDNILISGEVL
jgi:spermidine synthase